MNIQDIIKLIENRVDKKIIDTFKINLNRKKLVYTSFNGDYMSFLPDMLNFTLLNGYIPINPEAALGYYVSTKTHGGKKVPVMKDCIKTELLCDELWIFNDITGHIPEGVLAEMMVWNNERGTSIKIIPFFDRAKVICNSLKTKMSKLEVQEMTSSDIKDFILTKNANDISEINEKLLNYEENDLTSVYIVANFYNFKHMDWTREYCYKNNFCPVSPQNLLPYSSYNNIFDNFTEIYLLDRLTILEKAKKLIYFSNLINIENEVSDLDYYSCTELYYWYMYKNPNDIIIVDWSDAEVPKYMRNTQWALTSAEVSEVQGKEKLNSYEIMNSIISYEESIKDDYNIFKGDLLESPEREMISTDMNAFIFGLISDQSVKAELAWSLPYRLKERLGHFDLKRIIKELDVATLEKYIKEKPSLHRYPANIAKYLYAASQLIEDKYEGLASNIWSGSISAVEIIKRLKEFKGISHKKAALGCLLLLRDLGIDILDKENINLAYDIHIRRICLRAGFCKNDTIEDITSAGRMINSEFPGRLTSSFWAIGRDICRPTNPLCGQCPIEIFCEKNISLGGNIHA